VVLGKELKLSVGRCWASVPAQVCQPALLSGQSSLGFHQGWQTAQHGRAFIYFNETLKQGLGLRSKRPVDLSIVVVYKVASELPPYVAC